MERERRSQISSYTGVSFFKSTSANSYVCVTVLNSMSVRVYYQADACKQWFFLGLYDDHRQFSAFFTAICQGILGRATPLWSNFRPKIRQRDAAVAGKVNIAQISLNACFMTPHCLFGDGCIVLVRDCERRTFRYPGIPEYPNI